MSKPFGIHELLARVEALLRRSRIGHSGGASNNIDDLPDSFQFGDAVVDRKKFVVELAANVNPLSARELKLLEVFAQHPDEVLTRDQLLNAVWGIDYYGTTRTLDQHIVQLRKKVELSPSSPNTILTVHGIGYRHTSGRPR